MLAAMQPTPTEAAQQEFDQQRAAFERARQKLAAARSCRSETPAKVQPFNTVERFFRLVNKPMKHSKLAELVLSEDLKPSPRRSIPLELAGAMPADLDADPGLIDYWTNLTRDKAGRPNRWHFEPTDFKQSKIADDLVFVSFRLRRTPNRPTRDLVVAGLAIVPATVVCSYLALYVHTLLFALALALFSQLPFTFLRRLDEKASRAFNVRKLLVRFGEGWRLFCGDWEAYEEADLSWLDSMPPQNEPQARGVVP